MKSMIRKKAQMSTAVTIIIIFAMLLALIIIAVYFGKNLDIFKNLF